MLRKPHHLEVVPGGSDRIVCQGLSLADLRLKAYQDVNLDLAAGRAHAICAEDKGGKTELLLTLAGRMHPSSGSCEVFGNDVTRLKGMRAVSRESALAFFDNVNDVERGLRVRTIASAELGLAGKRSGSAATRAFLADWELLEHADSTIEELPRPVYDRLGVVLALAHDPRLLLVSDIERDMTEHESAKLAAFLCDLAHTRGITVVCGVLDYDLASRFDTATCITEDARAQMRAWSRKHQGKVA